MYSNIDIASTDGRNGISSNRTGKEWRGLIVRETGPGGQLDPVNKLEAFRSVNSREMGQEYVREKENWWSEGGRGGERERENLWSFQKMFKLFLKSWWSEGGGGGERERERERVRENLWSSQKNVQVIFRRASFQTLRAFVLEMFSARHHVNCYCVWAVRALCARANTQTQTHTGAEGRRKGFSISAAPPWSANGADIQLCFLRCRSCHSVNSLTSLRTSLRWIGCSV